MGSLDSVITLSCKVCCFGLRGICDILVFWETLNPKPSLGPKAHFGIERCAKSAQDFVIFLGQQSPMILGAEYPSPRQVNVFNYGRFV